MELHKLYDRLYNWIFTFGPRLVGAIIFFILALWIIKLIKRWLNKILLQKHMGSSVRPFIVNLTVIILQLLAVFALLQILSLKLTIFTAIIGGISVAAGLALSGTLQNFTSGILILLLKPFRSGDFIVAQGQEGVVKSIQIFYTIIITPDNKRVIIPNSKLSNEVIINLSQEGIHRMDIAWKLGFNFDFEKIKETILSAVKNIPQILSNPGPIISITEIKADGYKIELYVWLKSEDFLNHKLNLQEKIISELKKLDVKLPGL